MVEPAVPEWVVDQALVTADRDLLLTLALGFCYCCCCETAVLGHAGLDADRARRLAEGAGPGQPLLATCSTCRRATSRRATSAT